jgi:hypothetical protein
MTTDLERALRHRLAATPVPQQIAPDTTHVIAEGNRVLHRRTTRRSAAALAAVVIAAGLAVWSGGTHDAVRMPATSPDQITRDAETEWTSYLHTDPPPDASVDTQESIGVTYRYDPATTRLTLYIDAPEQRAAGAIPAGVPGIEVSSFAVGHVDRPELHPSSDPRWVTVLAPANVEDITPASEPPSDVLGYTWPGTTLEVYTFHIAAAAVGRPTRFWWRAPDGRYTASTGEAADQVTVTSATGEPWTVYRFSSLGLVGVDVLGAVPLSSPSSPPGQIPVLNLGPSAPTPMSRWTTLLLLPQGATAVRGVPASWARITSGPTTVAMPGGGVVVTIDSAATQPARSDYPIVSVRWRDESGRERSTPVNH